MRHLSSFVALTIFIVFHFKILIKVALDYFLIIYKLISAKISAEPWAEWGPTRAPRRARDVICISRPCRPYGPVWWTLNFTNKQISRKRSGRFLDKSMKQIFNRLNSEFYKFSDLSTPCKWRIPITNKYDHTGAGDNLWIGSDNLMKPSMIHAY